MPSRAVISAVFFVVAAAMLVAAAYRARGLRERPWPPNLVALVLTLGLLAISFALQAPLARELQNSIVINLGQLLGNVTTLMAACAALALVLFILYDPPEAARQLRPRVVALAVVVIIMTVLFATNPTPPENFTSPNAPLGIIAYYLLYLVYLATALTDLILLVRRYARRAADNYLRWGMHIVAAGCAVGLVYMVGRAINLTVDYFGFRVPFNATYGLLEFVVAAVLPSIAVLLAVAGFTFTRWGPRAAAPLSWFARRRSYRASYRRLEPLWAAVHDVLPRLAFPIRDTGSRPRLRLYGRTVEINDAELVIAPYVPSGFREQALAEAAAAGLDAEAAAAVADAAVLVVGLCAVEDDRRPVPLPPADHAPAAVLTEVDLAREVARLERMAAAFTQSPLVEQLSRTAITA